MSKHVPKEWIEACQIEQNSSMETAASKLSSEHRKKFGSDYDIVVMCGNKYSLVPATAAVPQYYTIATINEQPVVSRRK